MSWRDQDAERDRIARRTHVKAWRHHTHLAEWLRAHGEPDEAVQFERERANEARLRSWGWLGPVPKMSEAAS